ncbi:reverse transcriptase [Gossypium australe]|uniref:Reverse transcriptase n=1 Tax=Gossypium australe TaxID=47621 RepID=A0A5B6VDT2_9ROSI|nr:reverse transcriptase [Gossypium australe]
MGDITIKIPITIETIATGENIMQEPIESMFEVEATIPISALEGCNYSRFHNFLKEYMREFHPDLVSLFETRINRKRVDNVIAKLGFANSFQFEANGYAGGLWIFWNDNISMEVLIAHPQFQFWSYLVSLYNNLCKPATDQSKNSLEYLDLLPSDITEPCVMDGDFNSILNCVERKRGTVVICFTFFYFNMASIIWGFKDLCSLRIKAISLYGLKNLSESFAANSTACHLYKHKSDHRPLLVSMNLTFSTHRERLFRFLASWLIHLQFKDLVRNTWNNLVDVVSNLERFVTLVQDSNKRVFKVLWYQKSRSELLAGRDRNTKFFHNIFLLAESQMGLKLFKLSILDGVLMMSFFNKMPLIFKNNSTQWSLNLLVAFLTATIGAKFLNQFRLISPCTIIYNIITKTLQASFIVGRNISENIIIAQEAMHTMNTTKSKKYWMAVKVDLEKAYDRIR